LPIGRLTLKLRRLRLPYRSLVHVVGSYLLLFFSSTFALLFACSSVRLLAVCSSSALRPFFVGRPSVCVCRPSICVCPFSALLALYIPRAAPPQGHRPIVAHQFDPVRSYHPYTRGCLLDLGPGYNFLICVHLD